MVFGPNSPNSNQVGEGPIKLQVRQPSFSSLTGDIVVKGGVSHKKGTEVSEMELRVDSSKSDSALSSSRKRRGSYTELPFFNIDSGRISSSSEEITNPIIVLDESDDENANISLSVRQPSFASMTGSLIMKDGNSLIEQSIVEVPEEMTLHRSASQAISLTNPIIVLGDIAEDDDKPICLSVRQPSFSSMAGSLIMKGGGSVANLLTVEEEPKYIQKIDVIPEISSEPSIGTALSPQSSLPSLNEAEQLPAGSEKQHILDSLHHFNAQRWKEIGYYPTPSKQNCNIDRNNTSGGRNTPNSELSQRRVNSSRPINETQPNLILEMPQGLPEINPVGKEKNIIPFSLTQEDKDAIAQGSINIPPQLYAMIHHPKDSIIFMALCGLSIFGYPDSQIDFVISELEEYVKLCDENHLKEDQNYIKGIIDDIKNERIDMQRILGSGEHQTLDEKLEIATNELERRQQMWSRQESALDEELSASLEEIETQFDEEMDQLEKTYRNRRVIKVRTNDENKNYMQQMNDEYHCMVAEKRTQFENQRSSIILTFNTRRSQLKYKREQNLKPIKNRINRIQQEISRKEPDRVRSDSSILSRKASLRSSICGPAGRQITGSLNNKSIVLPPLAIDNQIVDSNRKDQKGSNYPRSKTERDNPLLHSRHALRLISVKH